MEREREWDRKWVCCMTQPILNISIAYSLLSTNAQDNDVEKMNNKFPNRKEWNRRRCCSTWTCTRWEKISRCEKEIDRFLRKVNRQRENIYIRDMWSKRREEKKKTPKRRLKTSEIKSILVSMQQAIEHAHMRSKLSYRLEVIYGRPDFVFSLYHSSFSLSVSVRRLLRSCSLHSKNFGCTQKHTLVRFSHSVISIERFDCRSRAISSK